MTGIVDIQKLLPWVQQSLKDNTNLLAKGYQGQTLLYVDSDLKIVIKTPHGNGLTKYIHTRLLRHEYEAYKHLYGVSGVPKCYGLIDDTYLAIEYIEADTIRQYRPSDDSSFYQQLFDTVERLHASNVAHADLKKKDNLLVSKDGKPYIIDFGVAIIYKPGFHILNHYLFRLGKRFDYNAWIKHKYMGRMDDISDADMCYFNRTMLEKLSSKLKQNYMRLKDIFNR